jgi:PAS domain S-box-containing protein
LLSEKAASFTGDIFVENLIELLGADASSSVYHLLVILALGAMALIAFIEWRHTRNPDHRRIVLTFAAMLALRFPLLFGQSRSLFIIAPLISGLETAGFMLLGWAFLAPVLGRRVQRLSLYVGAGVIAIGAIVSLVIWSSELSHVPASMRADLWQDLYDESWLQSLWLLTSVALTFAPAAVLLVRRQREEHWIAIAGFAILGLGTSILFLGALLRLVGQLTDVGHSGWIGWGRVVNLLGHSLFAVAIYRIAMQDMWSYRQELKTMSEEALRQAKEMFFLLEASRTIGESLNLDAILKRVVESAAMALDADRSAIFMLEPDAPKKITLTAQYASLQRPELMSKHPTFPLNQQPTLDYALQRRKQLILNDAAENPRLRALYKLLGGQKAGPTVVQPFLSQDRVLGALIVGNDHSRRAFGANEGRLCQSIATQVTSAIENARLYQDLQKQAGQLAQLLQSQDESVQRTSAILESIAEGVIVSDADGRITTVNAAAERILGTGRERLLDRPLKGLSGHTALDPATDWEVIATADGPLQTVFELEGKSVHVNAAPVLTPTGDNLGVVAVLRDITREIEAERAKSEFITAISHELRTPLTAIQGYTEALTGGMVGALSEAQSHFLGIIHDNALRMGSLAENLIAISEVEQGGLKLEYVDTDIPLIIGDVVRAFRSEMEARELELVLEIEEDLPLIEADPARVRQILDNLVSNAVKFTYPGGRVTIGSNLLQDEGEQRPSHCVVWVKDTGIGIPPKEQTRIWERFYRPSNPLAVEASGLGVGLSIVKSLVAAHKGRVWLESTPGQGSTFTVILPIECSGR